MGRIDLPKDQWKALANAIEAEYKKQPVLFPGENENKEIQKLAKHYATLISQNELNKAQESSTHKNGETAQESHKPEYKSDYETVD